MLNSRFERTKVCRPACQHAPEGTAWAGEESQSQSCMQVVHALDTLELTWSTSSGIGRVVCTASAPLALLSS